MKKNRAFLKNSKQFIQQITGETYLKVVTILGAAGQYRKDELCKLTLEIVEHLEFSDIIVATIPG